MSKMDCPPSRPLSPTRISSTLIYITETQCARHCDRLLSTSYTLLLVGPSLLRSWLFVTSPASASRRPPAL